LINTQHRKTQFALRAKSFIIRLSAALPRRR
jgi:hypothetical protein